MNSDQLERWLRQQGMDIRSKGGTGHKLVINPKTGQRTDLPKHGGRKELGTGLVSKIKKSLGL